MATSTPVSTMKGSVLGVILHDLCEEIRLEQLRDILGARRVEPSFKHATPDYVRFENPPVAEQLEPVVLASGEKLIPQIKYYDYGVVSVLFEIGIRSRLGNAGTTGGALGPESRARASGTTGHSWPPRSNRACHGASLSRLARAKTTTSSP